MKKLTLCVIIIAMAMGMVFAQGGQEAAGREKGSEIRVVTFFAGSDQWAPVWKEVISKYMKENPGVTIVDESQPTAGSNDLLRNKVRSEIAAKTPPDLMLYYNGAEGASIMDSEQFVDFTSLMEADANWAGNLKASAMAAGNKNGYQYCIPFIGYFEGLYYNQGLFDKYGLEAPTTWENILASIDTFNKQGISTFSTTLAKPNYLIELFILSQVGTEGQKDYFGDSWAPALDAVKQLYEAGAFPPDAMTMSEDDIRLLFADEKAAMMINGSWLVSRLKDNKNMRLIAMPALPGGVGGANTVLSGFGSGWYLSKEAAKRDDETLKFLKYLTSPEVMTRFIAIGGSPAVKCNVPEGATNLEVSAVEMLNTATFSAPAVDSQVAREAWLTLTKPGVQYICEGVRTPEQVLKEARSLNN